MGVAHGASDAVHLLPPHVYLQLLLGWGEHGLPGGAGCATVALSHIAALLFFSSARPMGAQFGYSVSPQVCRGPVRQLRRTM